jgi:hypothetical protein
MTFHFARSCQCVIEPRASQNINGAVAMEGAGVDLEAGQANGASGGNATRNVPGGKGVTVGGGRDKGAASRQADPSGMTEEEYARYSECRQLMMSIDSAIAFSIRSQIESFPLARAVCLFRAAVKDGLFIPVPLAFVENLCRFS